METSELKKTIVELMETTRATYLTTIEDGYPYTRAMLNLRDREQFPSQAHLFEAHQDDLMIYFSTNTASGKLRQIKDNPRVAVYYCDPATFHGVMLSGDIEIVDDSALRHALWNDGWERYYPGGPDDSDHTVLRLYPKRVRGWYQAAAFEFEV